MARRRGSRRTGLPRRLAKTVTPASTPALSTTTYFIWDGWTLLETLTRHVDTIAHTDTVQLTAEYLPGRDLDEHLAAVLPDVNSGEPVCFHQNQLGNVLAVSAAAGTVLQRYRYDTDGNVTVLSPEGAVLGGPEQVLSPAIPLFTGRELDPETGLYYFRNRYYSPLFGRFTSPDPLDYVDGMNVYAYVGGNTVNATDPMGLAGKDLIAVANVQRGLDRGALGDEFVAKWQEVRHQLWRSFDLEGLDGALTKGQEADDRRTELDIIAHLYLKAHYTTKFSGGRLDDLLREKRRPVYGDSQQDVRHNLACFDWAGAIYEGMEATLKAWAETYKARNGTELDTELSCFGWVRVGNTDPEYPKTVGHNYVAVLAHQDSQQFRSYDWPGEQEARQLEAQKRKLLGDPNTKKGGLSSLRRQAEKDLSTVERRIEKLQERIQGNARPADEKRLMEAQQEQKRLQMKLGQLAIQHPSLPSVAPGTTDVAVLDSWSAVQPGDFADRFEIDTSSHDYGWNVAYVGPAVDDQSGLRTNSWFLRHDGARWRTPRKFPTMR